jgi:hypothetical protein
LSHDALVSLLSGLGAGALGLVAVAGVVSQIVWILPLIGVALRWYSYRKGAPHLSPEGCEIRLKSLEGWKDASHEHHQERVYNGGIARPCSNRWIGTIRNGGDCLWHRNGGRGGGRKRRSHWGSCRRRQEGRTNRYRRWSGRRCHLRCDSISRPISAAESCWLCQISRLPPFIESSLRRSCGLANPVRSHYVTTDSVAP